MSLKGIVNDKPLWDSLTEELDKRIADAHKSLEAAILIEDVYRHQGEIRALRKLKQLRDKVNGPQERTLL
jgi:hypothetical protein